MTDKRAGMVQVEITRSNDSDLLREVYIYAKALRELSLMSGIPIKRNTMRRAEALLDLAISNYEND